MRASVWKSVAKAPAKRATAALGVATIVSLLAGASWAADAPPIPAPAQPETAPPQAVDERTDVVLTIEAPIVRGRNLLWCATGQLAWDALADLVGTDGRLDLEGAQDPALVDALNRRTFPHDALDAASVAVAAGFGKDGVLDRVREAWTKLYPDGARAPVIVAAPEEAVAFAALRKQLPFVTSFCVLPEPMHFDGGDRPLTAFGMIHDDRGPDADAQAKQVRVYPPPGTDPHGDEGTGVVELRPADLADRIFLSNLEPGATLEDAWNGAWSRVGAREGITPRHAEDLVIPRIHIDVRRGFPGIVGAHLRGQPDRVLRVAQQEVTFSLTERGATAESAALIVETEGLGMRMRFDRPFLLALLRRGATRPYFLAWVGNDAWLEPAAKAEPLGPKDLAVLGGRWVLDLEATVRANEAAELRRSGPGPFPDPKDRTRTITFEEALARRVAARLSSPDPTTGTATIDEHGWCTLELGSHRERLALRRVGDRWMLFQPQGRLRSKPSTPGSPEDVQAQEELVARGRPVLLRFDGSRLEIPQGALVFKRP